TVCRAGTAGKIHCARIRTSVWKRESVGLACEDARDARRTAQTQPAYRNNRPLDGRLSAPGLRPAQLLSMARLHRHSRRAPSRADRKSSGVMKKRLGLLAILCLLLGFAAGGFALWSYQNSQRMFGEIHDLQQKSVELEDQSDRVKGTPEESRLMAESRDYDMQAGTALSTAQLNRKLAIISGGGGLLLIIFSVVLIFLNIRSKEADLA